MQRLLWLLLGVGRAGLVFQLLVTMGRTGFMLRLLVGVGRASFAPSMLLSERLWHSSSRGLDLAMSAPMPVE